MVNLLFEDQGQITSCANGLSKIRDNPMVWVYRVNQFFACHQTNPHHRVMLASFHMEGKTLVWFQDLEASGTITSWEGFL